MIQIPIRPLSVNEGYTGRRFKTKAHRAWEKSVLILLPNDFKLPILIPKWTACGPDPGYEIYLKFGFSSAASDFDNCVKFFVDCLQKKYKFNDKLIRRAIIETAIVSKGQEFIQWSLTSIYM